MAVHLLPPGGYAYDLDTLRPSLNGNAPVAPSLGGRTYPAFTTPAGAGSLFLAGGLGSSPSGASVQSFVTRAGGGGARIVVLAAGYAKSTDAQAAAKSIATSLQPGVVAPVRWIVLDGKTDVTATTAAVAGATGIYVTAPDPSRVIAGLQVKPTVLATIQSRWTSGAATLLADDAAAAALGPWFASDPLPADIEAAGPEDLLPGGVTVSAGLGWVGGLTVTPRLLPDQRWGQVFQLIAAHPTVLGVGVDAGTALEVRAGRRDVARRERGCRPGRTQGDIRDSVRTVRAPLVGSCSRASTTGRCSRRRVEGRLERPLEHEQADQDDGDDEQHELLRGEPGDRIDGAVRDVHEVGAEIATAPFPPPPPPT